MHIFYSIMQKTKTASTNDDARALVESGVAQHGAVIVAEQQSAGRGRLGRTWDSRTGNLFASLILFPQRPRQEWFGLSFVMALAISDAIKVLLPPESTITLKWPNDVLANSKKISGILCEIAQTPDKRAAIIIGFGVNCVAHPEDTSYPATNCHVEINSARHPSEDKGASSHQDRLFPTFAGVMDVLKNILEFFDARYHEWGVQGFATTRRAWLERAHGLGKEITINAPHGSFKGIFKDLAVDGALHLARQDGTEHAIHAGDVSL